MAEQRKEYSALGSIIMGIVGYLLTGLFLTSMLIRDPAPVTLQVYREGPPVALVADLPIRAYDVLVRTDRTIAPSSGVVDQSPKVNVESLLFTRNPALFTWITMASILVAFALATLPYGWFVFRRFNDLGLSRGMRWRAIALAFVICVLIAITQRLIPGFWAPEKAAVALKVMFEHDHVSQVPLMVALLSASFFIGCALCVDRAAGVLAHTARPLGFSEAARKFHELRTILQNFLGVTSILVGLGVVNSAIKRLAIRHYVQIDGLDVYPLEYIHVYGLFFSAFLAMIYLPIHFHLHAVGEQIAGQEGVERSSDLQDRLGLKSGPWKDAKGALTILLPLIGSYLPQVIGNLGNLLGE